MFENFSFLSPYFLLLLIFLPFLYVFLNKNSKISTFSSEVLAEILVKSGGISNKTRTILLLFSLAFILVSASRPVIKGRVVEIETPLTPIIIGLDISNSMGLDDIFPSRFEFAKNRVLSLLNSQNSLKEIGVLAFSDRAFLISPITNDINSLKTMISNLNFSNFNGAGTNIYAFLENSVRFFKDDNHKQVLIFSDGGDKQDFSREISFAKENGVKVHIFMSATKDGKLYKAPNGDIVLLKANEAIKALADESGGEYFELDLSMDMSEVSAVLDKFASIESKKSAVVGQVELFYYPLLISVVLAFMGLFSLPKFRKFSSKIESIGGEI